MTEVLFYHLTQTPLERTLPDLLEKSLGRGWRALVKSTDKERIAYLDDLLWTYNERNFLPHGVAGSFADKQPIYLTSGDETPNNADILMLIDGAAIDIDTLKPYARVCYFFDGNDPETVNIARQEWKKVTTAKLQAKYWAQDDGRWVQKAESKSE